MGERNTDGSGLHTLGERKAVRGRELVTVLELALHRHVDLVIARRHVARVQTLDTALLQRIE